MKIKHFKVAALLMAGVILSSSCVGSFKLFNSLASWNKEATNNKFINELLFIVISPAYAVCGLADVLVLNSVEFWTGSNPIASNEGKTKHVLGQDGLMYAVTTLKNGYLITSAKGEKVQLVYNAKDNSWSSIDANGKHELFRFNEDGTVKVQLSKGNSIDVQQNEVGLYQARMAVNNGVFYALK